MKLIKDLGTQGKWSMRYGIYECPVCLAHFKTGTSSVRLGKSTKCVSCARTKHGGKGTRIYSIFTGIKDRCLNSKGSKYKSYGAIGIKMCDEWKDSFDIFRTWSFKNGYSDDLTIDRINNDGDYTPENCRWVGLDIQAQNKGLQKNNSVGHSGISAGTYGKFVVQFKNSGKNIYLGRFDSLNEAVFVREKHIIDNNMSNRRNVSDEEYRRLCNIYREDSKIN